MKTNLYPLGVSMLTNNPEIINNTFKIKISHIPMLEELLKIEGVWLAGGFLRDCIANDTPKDIDLFFESKNSYHEAYSLLGNGKITDDGIVDSIVYDGHLYQLVHKEFYPIKTFLSNFDFTCVTVAFDGNSGYCHSSFLNHVINRELCVNVISKPLSSLNRVADYAKKGWKISESYDYILDLMKSKDPETCLLGEYYE